MEKKEKSKITIILLSIFFIILILIIARYITNKDFRDFIDIKFLEKQVNSNNLNFIEINSDDNPKYFAYDSYIGVIAKNILSIYNSKGNLENSLSINISNPIIETNEKYVIIAEKDGNKFYVINSTTLLFQEKIEEKIKNVSINKNGYISIIASNSTYNSIIIVFDNDNNELFKKYLPSTYAMCTKISNSNKYLSIGEIDYSGTVIKSNVKIIDINTTEILNEFYNPENEILTNIVFNNKDSAICSFSNSIYKIDYQNTNKIYTISNENSFVNIDMKNTLSIIDIESSGLFSYKYKLKLKSITSSTENIYFLDNGLPKKVKAQGNYIALNYGNQINIVNQNGYLKKSYISTQQIKDLILGNHICGIIYKDKIEIINL